MDEILEIGTDINSEWEFKNGDLTLAKTEENIAQSIKNRLNTRYGEFDLFYDEYGSFLTKFLGWRRNKETLKFMEMEITNTLTQDVRFQDIDVNLEYGEKGVINGYITLIYDDETDLSLSFVLNNMGIEINGDDDGD